MARSLRIKVPGHAAAYHVTTRVNGREYRLDQHMKERFINTLKRLKKLFYMRIASYTILDNHFHLLVQMEDPEDIDPKAAIQRWNEYHGKEHKRNANVPEYREYVVNHLTDISFLMKRLNVLMTREYNRHTGSTGTLWESRFKSTVVERGWAIVNCAAYIELNSFRAGISKQPETYTYSSLYWLSTGNKDKLVDIHLLEEGLGISTEYEYVSKPKLYQREIAKTYAAFVYEVGSIPSKTQKGKKKSLVITDAMKKRLKKYGLQPVQGSFIRKIWEYSKSRFLGDSEFAHRFYEEHINPGYRGQARKNHIEKWIHASGERLWSIFNILDYTLTRGSP
jgi:REP element-mobilizing transposase RayT